MPVSNCCGAEAGEFEDYGICPECREHCDWEEEEEDFVSSEKKYCKRCKSEHTRKLRIEPNGADPETWFWHCDDCGYSWNFE